MKPQSLSHSVGLSRHCVRVPLTRVPADGLDAYSWMMINSAATSASSTSQAESSPHPVGHRRRVCCSQKGEAGGHDGRTGADALAAARVSGGGSPRRFGVARQPSGVAQRRPRAAPISEHTLNMEDCFPGGAVSAWNPFSTRARHECWQTIYLSLTAVASRMIQVLASGIIQR